MYELSDEEKYKFLRSFRWDSRFRREIVDLFLEEAVIVEEIERAIDRQSIINDVVNDLHYEIVDRISEIVEDKLTEEIKKRVYNEEVEELRRSIMKEIGDNEKDIIKEVIERLASYCLIDIGDKEEIRQKVQDIMIKRRSYRSDLIDLSDD
jgi:hypothetical protein